MVFSSLQMGYFSEELQKKYNLWQIDTPLYAGRIPKPYKLPESFAALPGKIVYLSLGSLFSSYTQNLQKIVDILEKLPDYKYIVSELFLIMTWLGQVRNFKSLANKKLCALLRFRRGEMATDWCFHRIVS